MLRHKDSALSSMKIEEALRGFSSVPVFGQSDIRGSQDEGTNAEDARASEQAGIDCKSAIHLHAYGACAMVIVLLLHLSQTYIYGAYKGGREILWLSGCVLFGLVMGMAFTGYLLPWDQKAYFATAVGTNAASEVPLIGESLKSFMRGGAQMGTLTISRFFVFHVFLIPGCIFALVASHILLFRKAGAAGPVTGTPAELKQKTEMFYPRQVLMDLALTALLIIGLGVCASSLRSN